MLSGSHLIVLGLCRNPQLPQFLVYILHEGSDSLPDYAEIVIVHLLSLGRHRAEQGASGINQILSLEVLFLINQEILLLWSYGRSHALCSSIAE